MPEIAEKLWHEIKYIGKIIYDDKDSIGRRYRRQDAIGTPYCITIDNQTLQDETVTIRERDSMQQIRLPMKEVYAYISKNTGITELLKKL